MFALCVNRKKSVCITAAGMAEISRHSIPGEVGAPHRRSGDLKDGFDRMARDGPGARETRLLGHEIDSLVRVRLSRVCFSKQRGRFCLALGRRRSGDLLSRVL